MSYSSEIKDELARVIPSARHCRIAEITAIISLLGVVAFSEEDKVTLTIRTEHPGVARKYYTLLRDTFHIDTDVKISRSIHLSKKHIYAVTVEDDRQARAILATTKLMDTDEEVAENLSLRENLVIAKTCCKRAFIRGAFLATGSVTDPEKSYHMEIVCATEPKAQQLRQVFVTLGIDAKVITRKNSFIVYVKEGDMIVEALGLMEAPSALMQLENIRILKGMRNDINRRVNCETANISKTVSAAQKQIEDIVYIRDTVGLDKLPPVLKEMALLRMDNVDATLKELGEMVNPRVGKSGTNHRLQKISDFAQELRDGT